MRTEKFWEWYDEYAAPKLTGRKNTFRKMFEHLDSFDRPVIIVETGCVEDPDNWGGNGCSTLLFDKYVSLRGDASSVKSVDIVPEKVKMASTLVGRRTEIVTDDSVAFLRRWSEILGSQGLKIDLLYLDASHLYWTNPLPSQIHHHNELTAALPLLTPESMVAVDDSPAKVDDESAKIEILGKGALVAQHMQMCGADLIFSEYQIGWTNVVPLPFPRTDDNIRNLINRARSRVEKDNMVAAEQIYRLILDLCHVPKTGQERVAKGEACKFYANLMALRKRFGAGCDWFADALTADPLAVDYRLDMVMECLVPMGFMARALAEVERTARSDPEYPRVWKVLGYVHNAMSNSAECLKAWTRRLELEPNDPDAILERGLIALDTADYETAGGCFRRVMDFGKENKLYAHALHGMAMIAAREHRHEDAVELYDDAINSGYSDKHLTEWNKSISLHAIGRYKEGWTAHEHREFTTANPALYLPLRRFTLPRWKGEPATKEDGTPVILHVHCEAGSGDNICIARYLPMLRNMGFKVRYEAPVDMVGLLRGSMNGVEIVERAPDYPGAIGIKPFDYHVPIGSLPAVFGTDIDTVPWNGPYLFADETLAKEYADKLDLHRSSRKITVGLCWSSGVRVGGGIWLETYGRRKSMHYDDVSGLVDSVWLDLHGVPVSLQVGPERAQHNNEIVDLLPEKPDWSDTAALIANCDLVITVDTAVAHLAGAMGKPVWVMTQRDAASWHFLCWRPAAAWNERSPWYPTARVFRQHEFEQPNFWDDVVEDVGKALLEMKDVSVWRNEAAEDAAE